MNNLKNIFAITLLLIVAFSCKKEIDNLKYLDNVTAPANLAVSFDITQDNTGLVTIVPNAEGATKYLVKFGDVDGETPTEFGLNDAITHTYGEGVYTVEVTAKGITGLTTKVQEELNVTFKAPENLVVNITQDEVNPRIVRVSATADFATVMEIYFGDVADEDPVTALPGEEVEHTYAEPGDYDIKVVAKSGGAATVEYTETITISAASDPVTLPIDFESFTVNYAFTDFGNAVSSVIDNPDTTGINTSARVAQMVKTDGAETWAGAFLTLETPIDFTVNKIFKVKTWSPKAGATVKFKVENLDNGDVNMEVDAVTTVSNEWEELSFDFSAINMDNSYQKVVIFFDFGNPGDDSYYFYDDIKLVPASVPDTKMIEDFEGVPPVFTTFGNIADVEVVANPDQSGVNTTAMVAKLTKSAGSETWAGAFFENEEVLDLDNYHKINVKVWSPKSGIDIKLKLENQDASITYETDVINTTANAWEDLVFDFSEAPAADYIRVVIFFDFDNPGDDSVYYFDEIELSNGGGGSSAMIFEDFEGEPPVFTDFGNEVTQVVANPDQSGINTSANVAETTKPSGAETWAGTFFERSEPLDLATYSKISVKTWSPKSGIIVKVKLENSDASITHEVDMNTTVANAWEELSYDFSDAPAADYIRVVIFFDFNNPGDDTVYYFDDYALTN